MKKIIILFCLLLFTTNSIFGEILDYNLVTSFENEQLNIYLNISNNSNDYYYIYNGAWNFDITLRSTLTIMGYKNSAFNVIKAYPSLGEKISGFFESQFLPEFEYLPEIIGILPKDSISILIKFKIADLNQIMIENEFDFVFDFNIKYMDNKQLEEIEDMLPQNNDIMNSIIWQPRYAFNSVFFEIEKLNEGFKHSLASQYFYTTCDFDIKRGYEARNIISSNQLEFKIIVKRHDYLKFLDTYNKKD